MQISDIYSGDHIKASDLKGKTVRLTITGWELAEFDDGNKLVIKFAQTDKKFVCNKTNAATIADMYGGDTDAWEGKVIQLFPTQTDFGGKAVPCIRVKIAPTVTPVEIPAEASGTDEGDDSIPF